MSKHRHREVIVEWSTAWPTEVELEDEDEVISARYDQGGGNDPPRLEVILIRTYEHE